MANVQSLENTLYELGARLQSQTDIRRTAQVHPVSIDHPCFYNLIRVHLWSIELIGHDLEINTPIYVWSHI